MDSTDSLFHSLPPTLFYFSQNSISDTTIFQNAIAAYRITSPSSSNGSKTVLSIAKTEEVVAVIERKHFASDTVTFSHLYDGQPVKLSRWITPGRHADGHHTATLAINAFNAPPRIVSWKVDPKDRLVLYADGAAVAHMLMPSTPQRSPPLNLVVDSMFLPYIEEILISWLVEEHRLRTKEGRC